VLKPDGFLCVVEPSMDGTCFPVMRPFHDETQVRTQAQAALEGTAAALFAAGGCDDGYRFIQPMLLNLYRGPSV
jgi:hypothetical protein